MWTVIFLLALSRSGLCSKFQQIVVSSAAGTTLENVMLDKQNGTVLVDILGDDKSVCITSNLHDLVKHVLAIKHIIANTCYLVRNMETAEDIQSVLNQGGSTNVPILTYTASPSPVTLENLVAEAGERIADFCLGYDTRWIYPEENSTRVKRSHHFATSFGRAAGDCQHHCTFCAFRIRRRRPFRF